MTKIIDHICDGSGNRGLPTPPLLKWYYSSSFSFKRIAYMIIIIRVNYQIEYHKNKHRYSFVRSHIPGRQKDRRTDGWTDELVGRTCRQTDGRTNGRTLDCRSL